MEFNQLRDTKLPMRLVFGGCLFFTFNPFKHSLLSNVADWPYSTFHLLVEQGNYPKNWAGGDEGQVAFLD